MLLTTQYLDEADRLADSIAVIDRGRVIAEGTSDVLKDRIGGERLEVLLADAVPVAHRPRGRGGGRRGGVGMKRLVTDTLVIAERNLERLRSAPDLLLAFTVQPVMFLLLFAFVFGGAIQTPGFNYVDFLIPGIIVQNIAFGGFVTAIGLNEDLEGADRPLPHPADGSRGGAGRANTRQMWRPTCSRWPSCSSRH